MPKKFTNVRCVYCLRFSEELTSDHVFPKSWYPDTTPLNLEKWQVPACQKCNKEYGKLEGELLLRLGLCLDPKAPKSLGVPDKVSRSINPNLGKTEADRVHRRNRKKKVLREVQRIGVKDVPKESIFPNFNAAPDMAYEEQLPILLSESTLKKFGEKLVRGITYIINNRYIERDHKIEIFFVHDKNACEITSLIKFLGKEYHCGPGVCIGAAFGIDEPLDGLFAINIWGKLRVYAAVQPREG